MALVDIRLVTPSARKGAVSALVLPVAPASGDDPAALAPSAHPIGGGLAGAVETFLADVSHSGKEGEQRVLPRPGKQPSVVQLIGIGDGSPAALRKYGAAAVRSAGEQATITVAVPSGAGADGIRALAEGAFLASYRFTQASKAEPPTLKRAELVVADPSTAKAAPASAKATPATGKAGPATAKAAPETAKATLASANAALATAKATATATVFARDMANTPSAQKDPAWFAAQALKATAKHGVTSVVRDPARLAAEGFNGILAVGGGSARGPRLAELTWAPDGARRHVVLVGKGITFDTGGISIKPTQGMQLMKKDMAGGAAVIGAVLGAALLKLPVKVTAVVPMAENMPSGTAYRPGDIVRHYGGRTSEILNTDAEGRVVLADALAYAESALKPDVLIDLATLTGAQGVALGKRTAALYTENDELAAALGEAADEAGERVWRMPLPEDYRPALDSDYADLNNAPSGGGAGSVTAALYLREFTGGARDRWVHVDMASPSWSDSPSDELAKGATGWGVRTLLRWLETQ
jgi:leucyl aminopeptidase